LKQAYLSANNVGIIYLMENSVYNQSGRTYSIGCNWLIVMD